MWDASSGWLAMSSARMPRTRTPAEVRGVEASTCPSTSGRTATTPGTWRIFLSRSSKPLMTPPEE